jgi:hypothetical protein
VVAWAVGATVGGGVGGVGGGVGGVLSDKRLDMTVEKEMVGEVEGIVAVGAGVIGTVGRGVKGVVVCFGSRLLGEVASTVGSKVAAPGSGSRLVGAALFGIVEEGAGVNELEVELSGPCVSFGFLVLAVAKIEDVGPVVEGGLVRLGLLGLAAGFRVGDAKVELILVAGFESFVSEAELVLDELAAGEAVLMLS